ncbi:uncharacterized protein LOC106639444 isoform X2 [Copidosoma floridanum]|nr:uncharacterized protein LOC106639444 isoform X2 [Copidosoma floridanum]XP_014208553.1 uncharacterized protein LOC106639444 isoform X2 [Copidosoma floridanum]XP_023248595.1 uncharacterized protein LOC106639444 isoform X2 [Copidosoma floridanum]
MRGTLVWMVCATLAAAQTQEAFNTSPLPTPSFFTCSGRSMGYYADVETNCRVYHTCDDHGNHFTHHCPEDTAFRQDAMICDHAYLVDCRANAEKGLPIRFSQDSNHDTLPSEPRGEGTNTRGFARSFRINPETKNDSVTSKYPTFSLNSSVFLTSRETTSRQPTTRFQEPQTRQQKTESVAQNGKDYQSPTGYRSSVNPSRNSVVTTQRAPVSVELQPPVESSQTTQTGGEHLDDEYSFLIPPPVRDDNYYVQQQNNFESLKNDNAPRSSSQSTFRIVTLDNFQKEGTTLAPHTQTILEMARSRALGREFSPSYAKPVNYLEPPHFKPNFQQTGKSNLNFQSNDPYKNTLLSLQKLSRSSSAGQPTTTIATSRVPSTKPPVATSIFAVPAKTLVPAGDADSDPYYPRSSTTEAYYTPRYREHGSRKPVFTSTTKRGLTSNAKFEIPAVLPDLNSLEDLLDRRKFFFIPQTKSV